MRARIPILISTLLAVSFWTLPSHGNVSPETAVGWTWDEVDLRLTPSGETEVRVDGAMLQLSAPGEPFLPAYLVRIRAPEGARVASVTIQGAVTSVRDLDAPIEAMPQDAPSIAGGPYAVERLESAYDVSSFPTERVQYLGIGLKRGTAWARFAVYPLVLEEGRRVRLLESGTLQIEWEYDASVPIPFKSLRESPQGAAPQQAFARAGRADAAAITDLPALESAPVDYLVLTTEELEADVSAFALWKNQAGTPTIIRTVEWVLQNYPDGADEQERIRNFLREAYRYWGTKWLLIVGGPDEVPIRTIRSLAYTYSDPDGLDIITDLYYACLDGTWNADGDQFFGEAVRTIPPVNIGDEVDFEAELYVGRVPATTDDEVSIWWEKHQRYVQNPVTDGYLDKILLLGEVLFDSDWSRGLYPPCGRYPGDCPNEECNACVHQDGADDCVRVIDLIEDAGVPMDFIELYEWYEYWNGAGRPNAQLEKKSTVVSQINSGVGILHHVGHGSNDRMSIGTLNGDDGGGRYIIDDANLMSNAPRYGVCYSINCNSAAINFDCLAEAVLFAENGGMVSYIGSSNLDFPTAARAYMSDFYRDLFEENETTIGETHHATVADQMAGVPPSENFQRFLAFSLILLGDPQMGVWLGTPGALEVDAATAIVLGDGSLDVRVTTNGGTTAIPGAHVCAFKINDSYAVGSTDGEGRVTLPFRPNQTGSFRITATHPRYSPYTENSNRVVNGPTGASISVSELSINDMDGAETTGNDNERFEEGETVAINVFLDNGGTVAAENVSLSLTIGPTEPLDYSELVMILDDTADSVSVDALATALVPSAFRLRLKPDIGIAPDYYQNGDRIPLVATIRVDTGAGTEDFDIPLMCYRPILALEQSTLVEIDGIVTPDGIPEVGETMQWFPVFRNLGTATATGLLGTLQAVQGATILTDTATFEEGDQMDLLSVLAPFEFVVNNAFLLKLDLAVRSPHDEGRIYFDREIEFFRPSAPVFPVDTPLQSTKDAIAVTWAASLDDDVQGYVLERSIAGEDQYQKVHTGLIRSMRYHLDGGLSPLTRYDYRVAAVDMSGNQGGYSTPTSATTTPGTMPGFPFGYQTTGEWGCPAIEDIDASGPNDTYEIFGVSDWVYGLRSTGDEIIDGDGVPTTPGIWSVRGGGYWAKPAIGDLDNDGDMEIVAAGRYFSGTSGTAYIHVWDSTGRHEWERPIFASNWPSSSPVICDIDADPESEIVVHHRGHLFAWNHDGTPVVSANSNALLAFVGGDPLGTAPYAKGSPAAADVDNDGKHEIILGVLTNSANHMAVLAIVDGDGTVLAQRNLQQTQPVGQDAATADSSPSLADVDSDGIFEIFIATPDYLWALYYDSGTGIIEPEPTWGQGTGRHAIDALPTSWIESTPAIGDVNGDGRYDVVVGIGLGQVDAVDAQTGDALQGFPYQLTASGRKLGSPILVQMNNDTSAEIVIGDNDNTVYALDAEDMEIVPGFPYYARGAFQHGLNYWDVDRNGHPNLVFQGDKNPYIHMLDISNVNFPNEHSLAMQFNPWTNFRHDARNTGTIIEDRMTPVIQFEVVATAEAGTAVLEWNVMSEPNTFQVERQDSDGVWRLRFDAPASEFRGEDGYLYRDSAEPGSYLYRVIGRDGSGQETYRSGEVAVTIEPLRLRLLGIVPNPFNPRTAIHLETPGGAVVLEIIDLSGRKVRTLADGAIPPGAHELIWDGRDDEGREVGSGVYMARLLGARGVGSRKMVLLR